MKQTIQENGNIIERTYRAVKYAKGNDGLYDMYVLSSEREWQEVLCQQDIYDGKEYKTKKGVKQASLKAFCKDKERNPYITAEYEIETVDTVVGDSNILSMVK